MKCTSYLSLETKQNDFSSGWFSSAKAWFILMPVSSFKYWTIQMNTWEIAGHSVQSSAALVSIDSQVLFLQQKSGSNKTGDDVRCISWPFTMLSMNWLPALDSGIQSNQWKVAGVW